MIQPFKTSKAEGIFVKVPKDVYNYRIVGLDLTYNVPQYYDLNNTHKVSLQGYNAGAITYEVLGLVKEITNQQKELICDKLNSNYRDCNFIPILGRGNGAFPEGFTIEQSFDSLLKSLNIYVKRPLPMPKEKQGIYSDYSEAYKAIQERLGNWLVLIKK